jgi:hypothetical protein
VGDLSNAKPFSEVPSPFRYKKYILTWAYRTLLQGWGFGMVKSGSLADLSDSSGSGFVPWKPQRDGKISALEYRYWLLKCQHKIRFFCLFFTVGDPDSLNLDPVRIQQFPLSGFRIRIKGFDEEKNMAEFFFFFKNFLHEGRPSYKRSLQPSKENIQHLKK